MNYTMPMAKKKRLDWVDCAKGFTILLVIIGHAVGENVAGNALRGIIFSFHMPLFFILSLITYNCSENKEQLYNKMKKGFKHLVIPALLIHTLRIGCTLLKNPTSMMSFVFWKGKVLSFIFSSGVPVSYGDIQIESLGVPWFLIALFIGRTLFDYLSLKLSKIYLPTACIGLSIVGMLLGKYLWLPFSLDIVLTIQIFFYVGYRLKTYNFTDKRYAVLGISTLVWLATLWLTFPDMGKWTYLEIACRRYPLYPICMVAAIAGTISMCIVSNIVVKFRKTMSPIVYVGKYSLYLLCVHCMDIYWDRLYNISDNQFLCAAARVVVDVAVFAVLMIGINVCKKIFKKN